VKPIYRGRVIDLGLEEVRLPNGMTVELEIVRHPGASAIVPLHDDGRVVMIRQYRHAAGGMIYEVPAGRLNAGEDPLDCARRELREEAGLTADRIERLGMIFTTPGFTNEKIHLFVARGLRSVGQQLDHDEVIEVIERPLAELMRMIERGEIVDGKTICALTLAQLRQRGDENG
jgi:ADP-ribose pyrophosphatase